MSKKIVLSNLKNKINIVDANNIHKTLLILKNNSTNDLNIILNSLVISIELKQKLLPLKIFWRLILNPTFPITPIWVDVSGNSICKYSFEKLDITLNNGEEILLSGIIKNENIFDLKNILNSRTFLPNDIISLSIEYIPEPRYRKINTMVSSSSYVSWDEPTINVIAETSQLGALNNISVQNEKIINLLQQISSNLIILNNKIN
jgi:hypothetical protein